TSTERKFGVVPDDPKIVAKVPFIISSDFIHKMQESNQESILNLLRTNPVKGGSKDTSPPTVNITSPQNGSSVPPASIVNVTVNTSDNIGVTSVTYKVDEAIVNTSTSSPYNFTWNTTGIASGSHTLTATAQDAAGNIGISSVVITVNTTVIIAPVPTSAYQIKMPQVTNQGSEGSCVAFAVGYAARAAEAYYSSNSTSYNTSNILSPEYLFDATKTDAVSCSGSAVVTTFEYLKTNGICTWQSLPYSSSNGCSIIPTNQQNSEAAFYKISSYSIIPTADTLALKTMLLQNHPLVISFNVDSYFYNAGPGFIWKSTSGIYYGRHAVAIVGFDDARQAFKIMNSWGTGWGDAGYSWIDYNFLKIVSVNAYVII
ncbi:MAG TPA: C1 family peptidase, partial [Chitinophagaceae bacterium]|nr:C1 family peptidase [Chitinophagaceae bacterium]